MPLPNYGLLTGQLVDYTPQSGGNPHYVFLVQAGQTRYRVAMNLESTITPFDKKAPELEYQVIDDLKRAGTKARDLVRRITNRSGFMVGSVDPSIPRLDYVHDGILNMTAFQALPQNVDPSKNAFARKLIKAASVVKGKADAFVAVFGSGYMGDSRRSRESPANPLTASFGFTGVENVHMNQGSFHFLRQHLNGQFAENGPAQDGAFLFFMSDGTVAGFFTKFASQDNETDASGNPIHTGIDGLDNFSVKMGPGKASVRNKYAHLLRTSASGLTAPRRRGHSPGTSPDPGGVPSANTLPSDGFVFANSPTTDDPTRPFLPDDDSAVRNSPFVANFAKYGVPEPVPAPRGGIYPVMTLDQVLGAARTKQIQDSGQIVFHSVGDTGAPEQSKLPNENAVASLMAADFAGTGRDNLPAFFFHLGDVVYFYGEDAYYYEQFYEPFKLYPAPIFAIPGNHDGITYSAAMTTLGPFIQAFCDSSPSHWKGAGGLARTTMTQPGVYFTLDAPFVSIIGLYSNCDESFGYLDTQQQLFLQKELTRLKPLRTKGQISAVILAVHHPPLSFAAKKPSSSTMRDDIDAACKTTGLWPDAVLSGHAHVYQRMTRSLTINNAEWQIPYVVVGAGGYNKDPRQEVNKKDMALQDVSDPQFRLHQFFPAYGYLKLILQAAAGSKSGTLRMEYHSPDPSLGRPADACVLDLKNHRLL